MDLALVFHSKQVAEEKKSEMYYYESFVDDVFIFHPTVFYLVMIMKADPQISLLFRVNYIVTKGW